MIFTNIMSFPAFPNSDGYTVVGYNVVVSRASGNAPNPMGTYVALSGYTGTTQNLNIFDSVGTQFDLYRVTPIVNIIGGSSNVVFDTMQSRPFYATQPLYDIQISSLIDAFRQGYLSDIGIPLTDSTLPTESTGSAAMPFMTDSLTTRFFLSFLQNDDPVKLLPNPLVFTGTDKSSAAALTQYTDFYVNEIGGYIDFKVPPPTSNYLRVEYSKVKMTNDEIRNLLCNTISFLSAYGINGFQVNNSNNLYYLVTPLPNRDLAELVQLIALKKVIDQQMSSDLANAESWNDGKVSWSADPGRALQAAASRLSDLEPEINARCNNYIYNTRTYTSRGEFESYFDCSGILPVFSLIVAGSFNLGGLGYWL